MVQFSSRTIVKDTLSGLIATLDGLENIDWDVELVEDPQYIIFQSVLNPETPNRQVQLQIWIQRDPFQITVVRVLESNPPAEKLPELQSFNSRSSKQLELPIQKGAQAAIIWKTRHKGLQYTERATILSVEKSVTADFMGFGEQGGKHLFKKKTYMNYFSKPNINMRNYYSIYTYFLRL